MNFTLNYFNSTLDTENPALCQCHTVANRCKETLERILASSTNALYQAEEGIAHAKNIDWQGEAAQAYRQSLEAAQSIVRQQLISQEDCQHILMQVQ